jgi:hypothetical protein
MAFQDGLHNHTFEDTPPYGRSPLGANYVGFHWYHSTEVGREPGATIAREMLRAHFGLQHFSPDICSEKDGRSSLDSWKETQT